jgi:phosphate-selective porin OprO/OprP
MYARKAENGARGLAMTNSRNGKRWILGGGAALAALVWASHAAAASAQDQEARIARLEAAVAALQAQVADQTALKQENAGLRAEDGDLRAEVETLQAQVLDLKSSTSAQIQDVRTAQAATTTSLGGGKPVLSTADGAFTFAPHGVLQFDAAQHFQDAAGNTATDLRRDGPAIGTSGIDAAHARQLKDGTLFRRARLGADGTVFKDFDYRILLDFGGAGVENAGQLYEGWVQYTGLKPLKVRLGAFSPSLGLEDQGSTNGMPFLERPGASDTARALAGGDTRTALQLFANGDHWFAAGAVTGRTIGVINTGTASATAQTYSDQLGLTGRIAFQPFHGYDWLIQTGVHGSYVVHPANTAGPGATGATALASYGVRLNDTPELRVDGTKFIDTGTINARHADTIGLELAAQKRNLFLQAEYESFNVERSDAGVSTPHFYGWYVEGTWILTGEARKFNAGTAAFDAPPVDHPFKLHGGGWGAWELGLRYSEMNLNYRAGDAGTALATTTVGGSITDGIRGGDQKIWTVGLNWYLNPIFRLMFDYEHVTIDRLSPNAAAYSTPVGAQIGQTYDVIAIRSQAAF